MIGVIGCPEGQVCRRRIEDRGGSHRQRWEPRPGGPAGEMPQRHPDRVWQRLPLAGQQFVQLRGQRDGEFVVHGEAHGEDGAVVGVVSGRYNTADGWLAGTVWVTRTEDLAALLGGISDAHARKGDQLLEQGQPRCRRERLPVRRRTQPLSQQNARQARRCAGCPGPLRRG